MEHMKIRNNIIPDNLYPATILLELVYRNRIRLAFESVPSQVDRQSHTECRHTDGRTDRQTDNYGQTGRQTDVRWIEEG